MSRWPVLVLGILGLVGLGPRPAYAQLNCNVGVDFYPSGAIRSCILNGDHRLHTEQGQSLMCANGHAAVLYENGRLQSCVLARPLTSGPLPCAAGNRVELRPDEALAACLPNPARSRDDASWHYALGRTRTAQQAILCRHREVVLQVAEVFRHEGPRAGYAALGRARGCETRVDSFTPRAVLAQVPIALAGDGGGYTVRVVEVATAAGLVEYLITTRDVHP